MNDENKTVRTLFIPTTFTTALRIIRNSQDK